MRCLTEAGRLSPVQREQSMGGVSVVAPPFGEAVRAVNLRAWGDAGITRVAFCRVVWVVRAIEPTRFKRSEADP